MSQPQDPTVQSWKSVPRSSDLAEPDQAPARVETLRFDPPDAPPPPSPQTQPLPLTEAAGTGPGGADALRLAFFKGLGLDPKDFPQGPSDVDEMEALGRRFRLLADGLVHLLRMRAKEKGSVRVAQTVIGNADVNPLKFLATTDDTLAALVKPRGKGYLPPEEAISAAYRDLSDHQVRTWIALQSSLRSMIDRFDPAAFEQEADAAGTMKALLSGGRNAKLWQLYAARYREIAKAAEDQFLGEVGADFRNAYEGKRRGE